MNSVFVMPNGDDPSARRRLTARTILEFCTAESQTALRRLSTRHMRLLRPLGSACREVVRSCACCRSLLPCELRLEQLMAVRT